MGKGKSKRMEREIEGGTAVANYLAWHFPYDNCGSFAALLIWDSHPWINFFNMSIE
jgi:hypothetical protein